MRETRTEAQKGTRRYHPLALTTLDGGCHDLRWQDALKRGARVITAAVLEDPVPEAEEPVREPVAVGGGDAPW